jgi:hypothetical protein
MRPRAVVSAAPDMTSRRVTRDGHAYCQGLARILDEAAWDGQTFTRVLRLRPSAARPGAPGQLQDPRRLHHLQRAEEEADQALRAGPHPVPHRRRAPRPDLRIHPQHQHSETVGRVGRRRPGRPRSDRRRRCGRCRGWRRRRRRDSCRAGRLRVSGQVTRRRPAPGLPRREEASQDPRKEEKAASRPNPGSIPSSYAYLG